jgi:CheY-like chemotaxis protein
MLEEYGYTIALAASGAEAIEQLRQTGQAIALVLMDIAMPVMDGVEAFRNVRRLKPDLPILVMTGLGEVEAAKLFRGTDIKGFIRKPFVPEQLAEKVRDALASRL